LGNTFEGGSWVVKNIEGVPIFAIMKFLKIFFRGYMWVPPPPSKLKIMFEVNGLD
jgi:hypothetical protein